MLRFRSVRVVKFTGNSICLAMFLKFEAKIGGMCRVSLGFANRRWGFVF